jgi:hypothetical protein
MIKVRINKGIAKRDLNRQIDKAQYLLDSLDEPRATDSYDKILGIREELDTWSRTNHDLLSRLFSGKTLLEEYDALGDLLTDEELSWRDEINQIKEYSARLIDWLRNLVERVDELPQSEKTPYVTWR